MPWHKTSIGSCQSTGLNASSVQLEPGFPVETGLEERRARISMFAEAAAVIVAEVGVDDIVTRGADPGQDDVYGALAMDVAAVASTWALLPFFAWNNVYGDLPPSGQLN